MLTSRSTEKMVMAVVKEAAILIIPASLGGITVKHPLGNGPKVINSLDRCIRLRDRTGLAVAKDLEAMQAFLVLFSCWSCSRENHTSCPSIGRLAISSTISYLRASMASDHQLPA